LWHEPDKQAGMQGGRQASTSQELQIFLASSPLSMPAGMECIKLPSKISIKGHLLLTFDLIWFDWHLVSQLQIAIAIKKAPPLSL
jgi:hypothetical protein